MCRVYMAAGSTYIHLRLGPSTYVPYTMLDSFVEIHNYKSEQGTVCMQHLLITVQMKYTILWQQLQITSQ